MGSDWIVKPARWKLFDIRLSREASNKLEGAVVSKGCDNASFEKTVESDSVTAELQRVKSFVPDKEFHLIAQYGCKKNFTSYIRVVPKDGGVYTLEITERQVRTSNVGKFYTVSARKIGSSLHGFDTKGKFGIQLNFTSKTDSPSGYWLTGNGYKNEQCSELLFNIVSAPENYWLEYFSLAKKPVPTVDDVEELIATLAEKNVKTYPKERDRFWKVMVENFIKAIPDQISSLPVDSPEARIHARAFIARIENLGFDTKTNFASHYSNRLFDQGVPVEPIHIVDQQTACQRANGRAVTNSWAGVEAFVGLSYLDWTAGYSEKFVTFLQNCADNNEVDSALLSKAIQTLQRWIPKIEKAADARRKIDEHIAKLTTEPKTLATLVNTKGYALNVRGLPKIREATMYRLYESKVLPVRKEAMSHARKELDALFAGIQASWYLTEVLNQCYSASGVVRGEPPAYLKSLWAHCLSKAGELLEELLLAESKTLDTIELDENNVGQYLRVGRYTDLEKLAAQTNLTEQLKTQIQKRISISSEASRYYLSMLDKSFEENSEEGDLRVINGCNRHRRIQSVDIACNSIMTELNQRQMQRHCDNALDQSGLDQSFSEELLSYGDGVQQRDMSLRQFICAASRNGVEFRVGEKLNSLEFSAIDRSSNRTLFNALMTRPTAESESWIVSSMYGALPNTLYGEMAPGRLVNCLLTRYACR